MFLYEPLDYHLKLLNFILLARIALVAIEDSACGKKLCSTSESLSIGGSACLGVIVSDNIGLRDQRFQIIKNMVCEGFILGGCFSCLCEEPFLFGR